MQAAEVPPHYVRRQFCWGWASGSSDTQTHRAMGWAVRRIVERAIRRKEGLRWQSLLLASTSFFTSAVQPERRVPSQRRDASKRCAVFGSLMGLSEVSLPLLHNDQMLLCVLTPKPARNGPLGWFMVSREPGVQQHFQPSIKLIFILPLKTLAPKTNRTLLSNITHLRDSGTLRLSLLSRFQKGPTRQNKTKQKRPWAFLLYFVFPVGSPATEWSKRSGPLECLVSPCRSLARNTSRLPETHIGPMYCVG